VERDTSLDPDHCPDRCQLVSLLTLAGHGTRTAGAQHTDEYAGATADADPHICAAANTDPHICAAANTDPHICAAADANKYIRATANTDPHDGTAYPQPHTGEPGTDRHATAAVGTRSRVPVEYRGHSA
jgi:hypothetical protein